MHAGLSEAGLDAALATLATAGLVTGQSGTTRRAVLAGGALLGAAGAVSMALPSAAAATSVTPPPPVTSNAYAWGRAANGQLGTGSTTGQTSPVLVPLPVGVTLTQIAASGYSSFGIGSDGNAYAWGDNSVGVLGVGDRAPRTTATRIKVPTGVILTRLSAASRNCVATGSDGMTYTWGDNSLGASGTGSAANDYTSPTPVSLPPGVTLTRVVAGESFCLGLSGVAAYAWGLNNAGQLGDGSGMYTQHLPVQVAVPVGVTFTSVAVGFQHSLATGSDGSTYAWGDNSYGELGNGGGTYQPTPVKVVTPTGVAFISIAAGGNHCLALGDDGKTYAWGRNDNGQLGDGTTTDRLLPVPVTVPALVSLSGLVAGRSQSFGIGSDGNAYAWGDNSQGETGDGTTTEHHIPTPVSTPVGDQFTSLASGFLHSLGLVA